MMKYIGTYTLLMFVFCISGNGQNKPELPKDASAGPQSITRNIIQDRKGNIWMAAFDGVFKYDGKSFTNVTREVSSARFFSVMEDRKGNLWFGSIGSGVYFYDARPSHSVGQGKSLPIGQASFRNFTTEEGLINNEVGCIYEDKAGNIWFGVNGGASRSDGKFFRNFLIQGESMIEDRTGKTVPNLQRPPNEVTSIIEDKTGKFWFCTRGNTFVYDGKTFIVFKHDGKPFINVRTIIEDKKGNIWLGGNDGLWRYNGSAFTNITQNFVGYIYEDRKGNIWTSAEENTKGSWALFRYDEKILSSPFMMPTVIKSKEGMIFGILEANDGSIWFGTLNGVQRYDGKTITDFK